VGLDDDLRRTAEAAVVHAADGEELVGIVPAEPASGLRLYVCAYGREDEATWLVLDATGVPVEERALVRDAVSIAALCEVAEEAAGIESFLEYSRRAFAGKDLMWFDSYNNVQVERETFSFPADGYRYFDYLLVSGFCVMVTTRVDQYLDDLISKLQIKSRPRILATLDYVDPWYTYNSMTDYAVCSAQREKTALDHRYEIDGIMFFANDEMGALVPRKLVESFAARFFESQ